MLKKIFFLCSLVLLLSTTVQATVDVITVLEMKNSVGLFSTEVNVGLPNRLGLTLEIDAAGKMQNNDPFTFRVKKFGFDYHQDNVGFFGGLLAPSIGQARINQVFLRESAPAFPNIGYTIKHGSWHYTKLYGDLGQKNVHKRLGIHYLGWQPVPYLNIGVGEAVIATDQYKGDLFYDFVPFIPYYFAKYYPGIATSIDNGLVYADGELSLEPFTLYGELVVNEFPMVPGATNPRLFAYAVGIESKALFLGWDLLAEYSQVSDQAYSNGNPDNVYAVKGLSLGHALGDDLHTADLQLKKYIAEIGATTKFGVYYQRLGNTDVIPWIGKVEPLIPEQVYGFKIGFDRNLDHLRLSFDLELGYVDNYKHQADKTGYRTQAVAKVRWMLP